MKEQAKKLVEEMNEVKTLCIKSILESEIDYIDDENFALYGKMFNLMSISSDLLLEQAGVLDDMNEKLDKLLEK